MSEFVPVSELDPTICALPLPNGFDEERIGVNIARLRSIAALGGFVADRTRIISVSGESSSESIGIAGASGGSAFGALTGTASKANTADSESQQRYSTDRNPDDVMRLPGPLTIKLNSTEIAQRVQRKSPIIRAPKPWATQIDHSLRQEMAKAVWRDTFTKPTQGEAFSSVAASLILLFGGDVLPIPAATPSLALPAACAVGLNSARIGDALKGEASWREIHFSLVPFFHVDRAVAATARLACGRLVKAL